LDKTSNMILHIIINSLNVSSNYKKLWFPFSLILLFGATMAILNALINPTEIRNGYTLASDIPFHFCDPSNLHQLIRQPLNTYTNLTFLFFGSLIIRTGINESKKKPDHHIGKQPLFSYLFGGSLIIMFFL
jgi:hypothetical protein